MEFRNQEISRVDSYLGNQQLKRSNVKRKYTEEEAQELVKCFENPIHFVTNHFKIVNLDHGLILFDMYWYQREIMKTLFENRFVILNMARQTSKCVSRETVITVRNKKTNKIEEIEIGKFYERHRNDQV